MTDFNRRQFLSGAAVGLGSMALGSFMAQGAESARALGTHFPAKAKRVIYLLQAGGPPQMELFDYKPGLEKWRGQKLPDSVRQGQAFATSAGTVPHILPAIGAFKQYGQCGRWLAASMPHIGSIVDDICIIDSMYTDHINHAPAVTFLQTGSPIAGRPAIGAWVDYGLGSMNANLPSFVVLSSLGEGLVCGQPLYEHLWGAGFLPAAHQGTKLRGGADPCLFVKNPDGLSAGQKRAMLDTLGSLNRSHLQTSGDPEIAARISQGELAYRMQTSVPDLTDFSDEPASVFELYGPMSRVPGTYAYNCLMARRMAERDVRFIQIYHTGWDFHKELESRLTKQLRCVDQASAALVKDLKQRGLLDDTLVVWGGEFGRSVSIEAVKGDVKSPQSFGRDHHVRCFTTWMAGAGVKPGISYGSTDDFSFNVVDKGVHIHDLQATMLERLGIDHTRLTARYQGRDFRLTDVHGKVIKEILS